MILYKLGENSPLKKVSPAHQQLQHNISTWDQFKSIFINSENSHFLDLILRHKTPYLDIMSAV